MTTIPPLLTELVAEIGRHLPDAERTRWPDRVTAAITEGADLSQVWPRWVTWLLREECPSVRSDPQVSKRRRWFQPDSPSPSCSDLVAALYDRQLRGESVPPGEWEAVTEAAWRVRDAAAAEAAAAKAAARTAEETRAWWAAEAELAAAEAAAAAGEAAQQQHTVDTDLIGEQTWAPNAAWAAAEMEAWAVDEDEMEAAREASYIRQANRLLVLLRDARP